VNEESRPWADKSSRLALETEPCVFFHPTLVGTSAPGNVQPVDKTPLLEEEPATWPQFVRPGQDAGPTS
jgi:hypothetical protein